MDRPRGSGAKGGHPRGLAPLKVGLLLALMCVAAGCGGQVGPTTWALTVQMSDSAVSLPSQTSIVLDPAPMKGVAQLQSSATVSYPAGVTVSARAVVPGPPSPGQPGRIVSVRWQGCDRMDGEFVCVVANLQSDRTVKAAFVALEVFPPTLGR